MEKKNSLTLDRRQITFNGERNVLEIARKGGIDIPTFCYHSALSIYGACRLCLVEIEGRGVVAGCSTPPEPGMVIHTHTDEIRTLRKTALELLLAGHEQSCPTCPKSVSCELQRLARVIGVDRVRFKQTQKDLPVDCSSHSLVRNPNKCVLCGDCVRGCAEIQSVGAIDFAYRGARTMVVPAFDKPLGEVECVNCGLCAAVCPTGAITPRSETDEVWRAINDRSKTVVVQVAPAVRVAVGELFGLAPGSVEMGRIVGALKAMGVDYVYDTGFTADLTVLEEAEEFLERKRSGKRLPQFTSCCPAWVQFAEQFFPQFQKNLSSCRSPQQMFGSLVKKLLPGQLGINPENLVVVSIMPCTAKKSEARLKKFQTDGRPDVDYVLTTQELAKMIEEAGLAFTAVEPQSLDMPFGFKTGAGIIFGASGGVTEAVLRYAVEKLSGETLAAVNFSEVRGEAGLREAELEVNGVAVKLAVVHGLANARALSERISKGEAEYDLIEVMACPGGCVGGAGQPYARDWEVRQDRARGLYGADRMLEFHKSQENPAVLQLYQNTLGSIGSAAAHELLHTHYRNRKRILGEPVKLLPGPAGDKLVVSVCVGTNCFVRGADQLLRSLTHWVHEHDLDNRVHVEATFCMEKCTSAPNVHVGARAISSVTLEDISRAVLEELEQQPGLPSAHAAPPVSHLAGRE